MTLRGESFQFIQKIVDFQRFDNVSVHPRLQRLFTVFFKSIGGESNDLQAITIREFSEKSRSVFLSDFGLVGLVFKTDRHFCT